MIVQTTDQRGKLVNNPWEGRCLEPPDVCPTRCEEEKKGPRSFLKCYTCDVEATCAGQLSSFSV